MASNLEDLVWWFGSFESAIGFHASGVEPSNGHGVYDAEASWAHARRMVELYGPAVRRGRVIQQALSGMRADTVRDLQTALRPYGCEYSLARVATWRDHGVAGLVVHLGAVECGETEWAFRAKCVAAAQAGGSRVLTEAIERTRKRLDACFAEYERAVKPIHEAAQRARDWAGVRFFGES